MVYVLSENGQPIMPTENHAKIRVLLKEKKAKVIKGSISYKKLKLLETKKNYLIETRNLGCS